MEEIKLIKLNHDELNGYNGGVPLLLAYAAAYATIYAAAHVGAYYKGYGDADAIIEPCTE